jgi:rhamnosyltransferase
MPPTIAIIMRAKNEMPYVEHSLAQLKRQTLQHFDLFAVDSGSTDGTLQALENSGCNLVQISAEAYVPGKVLNDAIQQTHHDIIVLLNADAIPQTDDWLEQLIDPIIGNQAEATFSKQVARPDAKFIVQYDYQRAYNPRKLNPYFFSAVACAFRSNLWEQHRFRETGYAEDLAWATECITNGARFQLLENSIVEHSHNYSLKGLYQKRFRQAVTLDEVPNIGKQAGQCFREIIRDALFAAKSFRFHLIPYHIAYRVVIYRAMYDGLKQSRS